jgi:hypothetical protein
MEDQSILSTLRRFVTKSLPLANKSAEQTHVLFANPVNSRPEIRWQTSKTQIPSYKYSLTEEDEYLRLLMKISVASTVTAPLPSNSTGPDPDRLLSRLVIITFKNCN